MATSQTTPTTPIVPTTVVERLQQITGAAALSKFSQIGFKNDRFTSGVCQGACLDWIRRILNATADTLAQKQVYDPAKRDRRLAKMAATHATLRDQSAAMKLKLETDRDELNVKVRAHAGQVDSYNKSDNQTDEEAERLGKQQVDLTNQRRDLDRLFSKGAMDVVWPQFINHWNADQKAVRSKDSKKTYEESGSLPTTIKRT